MPLKSGYTAEFRLWSMSVPHCSRLYLPPGGFRGGRYRREQWGTDMDHSRNSAVYPDFSGIQPSKEQKLRKRLYMPISPSDLTVKRVIKSYWFSKLTIDAKPEFISIFKSSQSISTLKGKSHFLVWAYMKLKIS